MENKKYDKKWRIVNSWIIIFAFCFGALSWIPFLIMGVKTKLKKWVFYAFIYLIPLISAFLSTDVGDGIAGTILILIWLVLWLVSIVHVFIAKKEYLLRLQAIQSCEKISDAEKIKIYEKQYTTLDNEENEELMEEEPLGNFEINNEIDKETFFSKEVHFDEYQDEIKQVNINTDSVEEIAQLSGIGDVLAEMAVLVRTQNGKFTSIEQVGEALGLNSNIIERLRPYVNF